LADGGWREEPPQEDAFNPKEEVDGWQLTDGGWREEPPQEDAINPKEEVDG